MTKQRKEYEEEFDLDILYRDMIEKQIEEALADEWDREMHFHGDEDRVI